MLFAVDNLQHSVDIAANGKSSSCLGEDPYEMVVWPERYI